jgi:hypothetical protein
VIVFVAFGGRGVPAVWPVSETTNWPIRPPSSCLGMWQWNMYGVSGSA